MKGLLTTLLVLSTLSNLYSQDSTRYEKYGDWYIVQTVDQFGTLKKEKTVNGVFYGTFSNTATTNSKLRVLFQIADFNGIAYYYFYEYDRDIKAELPDIGEIKIQVRLGNGKTETFTQMVSANYMSDGRKLLKLLVSQTEPVKILIDFENGQSLLSKNVYSARTKYLFEVNPTGLREAIEKGIEPRAAKKILK